MLRVRNALAAVLGLSMCFPFPAFAEVAVGEATLIKTEVAGENGPLVVKDPVHRDERIRTSIGGLGQFVFRDGTKLAVGAGSSVVIDSYVYDDANSVKKLTIKAAKGTFRWISGNSSSSAYSIVTPAGTIGVRGTAFDVYVAPNGTTAMVLLNGSAQFCGAGGCKQLREQCDCVIASRGGGVSDPRKVDETTLRTLRNNKALPFLSGNQQLSGPLGNIRTSCGLRSMRAERQDRPPESSPVPTLFPPQEQAPPSPQKPERPQKPDEPQKPDKPDKPHHHRPDKHHHDRDHDHPDRHHHDRDRDRDHWGGRGGHHDRGNDGGGWGQRSGNHDVQNEHGRRDGWGNRHEGARDRGGDNHGARDHADRGSATRDGSRDHADRDRGGRSDGGDGGRNGHNGHRDGTQGGAAPANGGQAQSGGAESAASDGSQGSVGTGTGTGTGAGDGDGAGSGGHRGGWHGRNGDQNGGRQGGGGHQMRDHSGADGDGASGGGSSD